MRCDGVKPVRAAVTRKIFEDIFADDSAAAVSNFSLDNPLTAKYKRDHVRVRANPNLNLGWGPP